MATIFEVQSSNSYGKTIYYGARRTRPEAEALLEESRNRVRLVGGRVHDFRIAEIDTTGTFEFPSRPTPRERFTYRV